MNASFQADLSFLFEQPSIWLTLVETLIFVIPLAIALAGYAAWRVGDRRGLLLIFWVCVYLGWMHWPVPLDPALVLPGRMVSVIGWFWLLGAWSRRMNWHGPLLLVANGLVAAFLLALFLTTGVATIRDIMDWDIPA
jgi:hypothetical protein